MTADKELWVFIKQKGGSGATDVCAKMAAIHDLAGASTLVLDADNALRSYKVRHGTNSAVSVPLKGDNRHPDTVLKSFIGTADVILLDLPGGFVTHDSAESRWVWHLIDGPSAQGMRRVFFYVASSNAPGSTENAIQLQEKLGLTGTHILVLNDSSGTGTFDQVAPPATMDVLRVGHVPPGIVAAVQQVPRPLAAFITDPPPGFRCAASIMAAHLAEIAESPALTGLLPAGASEAIARHSACHPGPLHFHVGTLPSASDKALQLNAATRRHLQALLADGRSRSDPHVVAFDDASRAYLAVVTAKRHEAG